VELKVNTSAHDGVQIVSPAGEIDVFTTERLKGALHDAESTCGRHDLIVDLTEVSFLDSTGIGVLVGALRRRREQDATLHLVTDRESILKILSITNLDTVFAVHPDLQTALGAAK
jgi:anti-sigma B factor antagonist